MDLVEPNWLISSATSEASSAACESPGPSCPKSSKHSFGSSYFHIKRIGRPGRPGAVAVAQQAGPVAGAPRLDEVTTRLVA